MKFKSIALCSLLFSSLALSAQEENVDPVEALSQRVTHLEDAKAVSGKLKISGYIQAQMESAQKDASTKVGDKLGFVDSDEKNQDSYSRMGIRRGRIKAAYEDNGCLGVMQFDLTEKGMALKDAYLQILDPWTGYVSLKSGVYDRPFGYEISYSSSRRESPERSRVFQTLFPDERDLGAMLVLQAPKTSPWNVLKLEAGLFAGNGIYKETDSKKDFIGHLSFNKALSNFTYGLGVSYYKGYVAQTTKYVYEMKGAAFAVDSTGSNKGNFANRSYIGFDGQLSFSSILGLTSLRGEYLMGDQPGRNDNSSSPKSGSLPGYDSDNKSAKITDTYIRKFRGGYVQLVQDIADTKHSITLKYDYYDPNTKVSGTEVGTGVTGLTKTNKGDVAYSTLGIGYLYRMNNNVRIMAYYDFVRNEKTSIANADSSKDFTKDQKDNIFTLRFQYKF